jgi:hypothetical protein
MNDIDRIKANSFFNDLDDRCTLILAAQGMRGHALYRILASHQEVWWDSSIMNYDKKSNYSSLEYPKENIWTNPIFNRPYTIDYMTAHTTMFCSRQLPRVSLNHINNYYKTSNLSSYLYLHADFIDYVNRPYIYVYTSDLRKHFDNRSVWYKRDMRNHPEEYNRYRQKLMNTPSTSPLAFNIDITKLFSQNEQIFSIEYIKIIHHFKFTSNIQPVNNFINRYLERERSISS